MSDVSEAELERGGARHTVEVADQTLTFRSVRVSELTATGAQLALAAGVRPAQNAVVLRVLPNGELEDVRPDQTVDLRHHDGRFVIVESDRVYFFTIEDERFEWPCRVVSGGVLRKLGRIPPDKGIYFERETEPDHLISEHDLVDLDAPGVEAFYTRTITWKLNVQGVVIEVPTPTIMVRDALMQAGFNPDQGWLIFLKIVNQAKRPVQLTDVIDLRTPGIERLRLTPDAVNNGEAPLALCHDFALLDVDEYHLNRLGLRWETIIDANRRFLLIHNYPLPVGYSADRTLLALEIPPTYPGAQIYGFYADPPLGLSSQRPIDSTQLRANILGREFHGWSRNRGPALPWNSAIDNVMTHLMMVDAALAKEVGE
jgi:Prokaryotic E2 family E/Multiubiquitin